MSNPTDEQLMSRFCRGEDSALEALFDRHAPAVQTFLARMVGDAAQAEDLLQMTFLSVVRSRGRYDEGTPFLPWLMTIAANAARSALRRRKHANAYLEDARASSPRTVAPVETDPSARRELLAALNALPAQQREAVVLHKVQGWSFEEIATALGITSGAARIRAHRGYDKLRELLAKLEVR